MTNYDDSSALMQKIMDDPTDFLSYLALADWHEEQGNLADSEACRWLGTKQRCPQHLKCYGYPPQFWWVGEDGFSDKEFHQSSKIPNELLSFIDDDGDSGHKFFCGCFDNQTKAIFALIHAFKKLTPEEKEACWRWEP